MPKKKRAQYRHPQYEFRVVILSHRGNNHLQELIPQLLAYKVPRKNLLVKIADFDTAEEVWLRNQQIAVVKIPDREFNHGATREKLRQLANSKYVVFLTQDIRPCNTNFLSALLRPLREKKAAVSFSRQLPHKDADFFACFARGFNYPEASYIRTREDLKDLGADSYFCSNSCAAWSNAALNNVGGFSRVLTGEDADAAAKLLKYGYSLAYVAESLVYHSHNYNLWQEFSRYFDTGYARRELRRSLELSDSDTARGNAFASALLRQTLREKPLLLPYAMAHLAAKWLGYRLGSLGHLLPRHLCRILSMQKEYWQQ